MIPPLVLWRSLVPKRGPLARLLLGAGLVCGVVRAPWWWDRAGAAPGDCAAHPRPRPGVAAQHRRTGRPARPPGPAADRAAPRGGPRRAGTPRPRGFRALAGRRAGHRPVAVRP